jgi:hypothetical protein
MDGCLRQSLEMLGLLPAQGPEVVAADLARIRCKALASFIAKLLNDEPLLKATCDGATVTVREIGGTGEMQFTIASKEKEAR